MKQRITRHVLHIRHVVLGSLIAAAMFMGVEDAAHAQPATPEQPATSEQAQLQDKERALALLAEGNHKLDTADYLGALTAFEQAYDVFPSPRLHFNIAQTLRELGRFVEALRHYELFVAGVQEKEMPSQWALANERIFQLQGQISTLALQCNVPGATVSISATVIGVTPLPESVRLMPGKHVVILEKPGYERRVIQLDLTAGAAHTERVELLTSAQALAQREEFQRAEASRKAAELRLSEEKASASRANARRRATLRTSAWITLGVGAAATVTAAVTGTLSWRENAKVEDAPAGTPWSGDVKDHYDRAATYRRVFYISAAVGAATLLTGGGLLLYSRHTPGAPSTSVERAALVPVLHPEAGAGLAVLGRF